MRLRRGSFEFWGQSGTFLQTEPSAFTCLHIFGILGITDIKTTSLASKTTLTWRRTKLAQIQPSSANSWPHILPSLLAQPWTSTQPRKQEWGRFAEELQPRLHCSLFTWHRTWFHSFKTCWGSLVVKIQHKGSSPKKKTGKCGNFEKTGGGVYPNPTTMFYCF